MAGGMTPEQEAYMVQYMAALRPYWRARWEAEANEMDQQLASLAQQAEAESKRG